MTDIDPDRTADFGKGEAKVLLIACGALGREIVQLTKAGGQSLFDISCLPAKWHNTPQYIVDGVRRKIHAARSKNYENIFVVYGDCGTGGMLDKMLDEEKIERIAGPHCYAFYSGNEMFAEHEERDVTAFYLTDYLTRHFEKLIWQGLALDRHPQLLNDYFGNYERLVYLAQTRDDELCQIAKAAAGRLKLAYEYRYTGYGDLQKSIRQAATGRN